jgi:hypothetical protein
MIPNIRERKAGQLEEAHYRRDAALNQQITVSFLIIDQFITRQAERMMYITSFKLYL